jgi:FAD/FMN-containing dehydrogenase
VEAFDRGEFLGRAGRLAFALGAGGVLSACSSGGDEAATTSTTATRTVTVPTVAPPRTLGAPTAAQLRQLAREVQGDVVTPGQPGYGQARLEYDPVFDGVHPSAVVYCRSLEDVERVVRWAGRHAVRIVSRCGGHSYGGYSTVARGVVVDVSLLKRITAGGGVATVGAGARLIDLYSGLWAHRVTVPGGSCATVGIAGLAQGGGVGLSGRKMGTTADNIRELTIVTADSRALVCNDREHADLYWACRGGGGGNFGIVTSFVFRTHPVDQVTTFYVQWPWANAAQVVRVWQDLVPHAPDALMALCNLSATGDPSASPVASAAGQFYGSEAELRSILRPLLAVGSPQPSIVRRSYLDAALYWAGCSGDSAAECHLHGASPHGVLGRSAFKAKSRYALGPLTSAGTRALLRGIEARQRNPRLSGGGIILDSYGGAINRVAPDATAFVHRSALFSMQFFASWAIGAPSSVVRANHAWIEEYYAAMVPHVSRFAYQNYIDPALPDWQQAYYGSNLPRLVSVKRAYDPDNAFHFRQSIPTHL